jgi:hypothetical protein
MHAFDVALLHYYQVALTTRVTLHETSRSHLKIKTYLSFSLLFPILRMMKSREEPKEREAIVGSLPYLMQEKDEG